ncbi:non-specific lipid transfer protein GPI-anchored 5-like [Malania oleifera]|uniref:non-specific lipid transfer protein GPI-anchored 5-like n=1 Tax=Malania oleifera TaxID=397392 RepID=UPI0025ADD367|nr:non-specific lipid transfer protein GPI-anchored 5-like [Malania oleifera]
MAGRRMEMAMITTVLLASLWAGAVAQSSCTNVLISLSPCLNYITGNSSTPGSGCCTQLASVVKSQPQCLCEALTGGGSSLGLNINKTLALELPNACNVQTPSINRCNGASPAESPAGTSSSPTAPSGSGSKTIPSADGGSSDGTSTNSEGTSTKLQISLLFFLLFVASYVSISATI